MPLCIAFAAVNGVVRSRCFGRGLEGDDDGVSGASAAGVLIRPAAGADVAAVLGVWAANGDTIPEGGVDTLTPYLVHLLSTGRVFVAEDGDQVVGFGAVVERFGVTHLADLFVLPDRFGEGIGGQLLDAVFSDAALRTTFASSDPRAMPLYVRAGMSRFGPISTSTSTRRRCRHRRRRWFAKPPRRNGWCNLNSAGWGAQR